MKASILCLSLCLVPLQVRAQSYGLDWDSTFKSIESTNGTHTYEPPNSYPNEYRNPLLDQHQQLMREFGRGRVGEYKIIR